MVTASNITPEERKVIIASSLGSVFEWYDFYLYGSLAAIIAKQFFSSSPPNVGFLFALLVFAAGFIARPFGALVFGRLGDMVGRKYSFLLTVLIMGTSTFIIGILPNANSIGIAAPIILITLRILQGLALGGEYSGAATYVVEHAPPRKRGAFTGWLQTTATLGLFLSLLVIMGARAAVGEAAFVDWGWRIPFLVSIILLSFSVWFRLSLNESPVFLKMKSEGKVSKAPLTEAFGQWKNLKLVILALVGLTAGQGVVWYTSQFYALFFLTQSLKIDGQLANTLIALALLLATPFFIVFGSLSDKIGRKPIILGGCLIAALTYFPIFQGLTHYGNPALEAVQQKLPISITVDPTTCHFQFDLIGTKEEVSACDFVKARLSAIPVNYQIVAGAPGSMVVVKLGDNNIFYEAVAGLSKEDAAAKDNAFFKELDDSLKLSGYPSKADPDQINKPMVVLLLFILVLYVTMVYGPIAAALTEMFPARIRYTAMSLPYHIGNGWFGGLLPTVSFALVVYKGDIYYGLWYPVIIALITFVIGLLFVKESKDNDV